MGWDSINININLKRTKGNEKKEGRMGKMASPTFKLGRPVSQSIGHGFLCFFLFVQDNV